METSTTADECDGNYKSKNITVYGNATIVKQKGLSVEQRKALETMTVVEGKLSIATAAVAVKASAWLYGNAAAVEAPIAHCEQ